MSDAAYLSTLGTAEAATLGTSLQHLKDHLQQELEWMQEQVEHKTRQLQGIEALLLEISQRESESVEPATTAPSAGRSTLEQDDTSAFQTEHTPTASEPARHKEPSLLDIASEGASNQLTPVDSPLASHPVTPESDNTPPTKRGKQTPSTKSTQRQSVTKSAAKKPGRPAKKPAKAPAQKGSKQTDTRALRQFMHKQFQDQLLSESVGEILARAKTPMTAKDVMSQLYEGLSGEDYNRAKNSIANVLTVGNKQGKWQSTGRGLYASHT